MIVVSDTSALWTLCAIRVHEVLPQLFGKVAIPPAVAAEFLRTRVVKGVSYQFPLPDYVVTMAVNDRKRVDELRRELDAGESEAIVLAMETRADLILMDEHDGRLIAERLGLRKAGVIGVLVRAKQRGLIREIGPLLMQARSRFGFHLSDDLLARVLADQGEEL